MLIIHHYCIDKLLLYLKYIPNYITINIKILSVQIYTLFIFLFYLLNKLFLYKMTKSYLLILKKNLITILSSVHIIIEHKK